MRITKPIECPRLAAARAAGLVVPESTVSAAQALAQQLKFRKENPCKHRGALIQERSACQGGPVFVCHGGYGECSLSKCQDYHDCGHCPKYVRG